MPRSCQFGLIPPSEEALYEISLEADTWVYQARSDLEAKKTPTGFLKVGRKIVKLTLAEYEFYVVRSVITLKEKQFDEAISLIYSVDGRVFGEVHRVMDLNGELRETEGVHPLQHTELGILRDTAEIGKPLWLSPQSE